MAADSVVRARIDSQVKAEASDILKSLGLTLSDAYRMLLMRVVEEGSLPFAPLVPNKKTIDAMREVRSGKLSTAKTTDDLFAQLNEND